MRDAIIFYLNGEKQAVTGEQAGWMLADYLRYVRRLTGTKIVCAEGDCGACTVLRHARKGAPVFLPVNSCILTVAQLDGSSLVTVDALSGETEPTPVQKAMVEANASQCGFCTPGFVMALTGLVERRRMDSPSAGLDEKTVKNALTGNLCRCTGYDPIIRAACSVEPSKCEPLQRRFWSPTQDRELKAALLKPVRIETPRFSFFAPRTPREATAYLRKHPDARILAAGTDLGVLHNKRKSRLSRVLSLHLIPELHEIRAPARGRLRVGSQVMLSELRRAVEKPLPELAKFLDLFASPQIKNVATLAGNLCNASPIADTPPFLLAANATLHAIGPRGRRRVAIEDFFLGYRKTALKRGEWVTAVEFDLPSRDESFALYKVSQRKDLDISTVNAAFRITWKSRARNRIQDARVALGGVAATPVRLRKTEALLRGAPWNAELARHVVEQLPREIEPISDLRGSAAFRRVACENLFRRFLRDQASSGASRGERT